MAMLMNAMRIQGATDSQILHLANAYQQGQSATAVSASGVMPNQQHEPAASIRASPRSESAGTKDTSRTPLQSASGMVNQNLDARTTSVASCDDSVQNSSAQSSDISSYWETHAPWVDPNPVVKSKTTRATGKQPLKTASTKIRKMVPAPDRVKIVHSSDYPAVNMCE